MTIKGTIEDIVYRNEENGYTVLVLDRGESDFITAVGKFPPVNAGEVLELTGVFTSHSKYGEQFNAKKVKVVQPTTKDGLIKYLSSGLIKGVGPVTATAIVEMFGESTLEVIEFNPQKLTDVRGISTKKAKDISDSFYEIKKMQNAVLFLQQFNVSTNMAVKMYNTYGSETENVLKKNPYKLIEDIEGVGFLTADKIARSMGVPEVSEFRFRAGILHVLKESGEKAGNTYLPRDKMITETNKLLGLLLEDYVEIVTEVISMLVLDGLIRLTTLNGVEIIALNKYYVIEEKTADILNSINFYNKNESYSIENEIEFYEKQNKIVMHEKQKEAIRVAVNSGVSVITGGPGTGKTTIVKGILHVFNGMGKTVKLLAPTGRAAKKLNESTGQDASTIHRALEIDFTNQNMFYYNQHNKLSYDVIVVDEVSMVDVQLFYYLLRAIKHGAKLILVGDKDQLPSVGAGNVLADILQSQVISVVELTHIYRQSEDSLIITNAHLINEGKFPIINNQSQDFFFNELSNSEDVLNSLVDMQHSRIPRFLNIENSKIQVLSPMKAGVVGVDNLNRALQERNNPQALSKPEIATEKVVFRLGDRVMQTSNNYERNWKRGYEQDSGVFNGDIGEIIHINKNGLDLTVQFEDGRVADYAKSDISELMLSYAITIHKSQGSEFDVVMVPVLGGPPMLLTRNLLYTAVTRAKKMVVLIGTKSSIRRMVNNNYTTVRYSLLKTMLIKSYEEFKRLY